jgi:AbiJ N-terminal domain 4
MLAAWVASRPVATLRRVKFSQRYGYTPVREVVQRESMDDDLRVGLWNVFDRVVISPWVNTEWGYMTEDAQRFTDALWHSHFKLQIDTAPTEPGPLASYLKKYFFECQWYEVYDLLEFSVRELDGHRERLVKGLNSVMEREMSAYRFVGDEIVEITSEEEIAEIEEALAATDSGAGVHLKAALAMLADRDSPDYRNSIKESISAVESIVTEIDGKKGTLGAALTKLGVDAHPSLREAFKKLYGYTSDAQGIRHALAEESDLAFEDAKFMLVACSAFVNYLTAKAARASVASEGTT